MAEDSWKEAGAGGGWLEAGATRSSTTTKNEKKNRTMQNPTAIEPLRNAPSRNRNEPNGTVYFLLTVNKPEVSMSNPKMHLTHDAKLSKSRQILRHHIPALPACPQQVKLAKHDQRQVVECQRRRIRR